MNSSALRTAARSGGPPRQTRTASGGDPSVANASLATTPVERMCPTKAERVQGAGGVTHKWKTIGSERMPVLGRIAAASRCRSINSRCTALSKASPVPSTIQRVASATVTGEAITVAVRTAAANSQRRPASDAAPSSNRARRCLAVVATRVCLDDAPVQRKPLALDEAHHRRRHDDALEDVAHNVCRLGAVSFPHTAS